MLLKWLLFNLENSWQFLLTILCFLNKKSEDPTYHFPYISSNLEWYLWDSKLFLDAIYHPPPIIDSAWKLLITDTKIYKEFWFELCGNFIDRIDPQNWKFSIMKLYDWERYISIINNWFKKYIPFWITNWNYSERNSEHEWIITIKKKQLKDVIDIINQTAIENKDQIKDEEAIRLTQEIHSKIIDHNIGMLICNQDEITSFIERSYHDLVSSTCPEIYLKIINIEFPLLFLSSFEKQYCIRHSEAILIMLEYFKFLTVWEINQEIFLPSKLVDMFWNHHISFDTKQYRDFWDNIFKNENLKEKYDLLSMSKNEKLKGIKRFWKFKKAYSEYFGYSPPQFIWPELDFEFDDVEEDVIQVNIFKSLFLKIFISSWNKNNDYNNPFVKHPKITKISPISQTDSNKSYKYFEIALGFSWLNNAFIKNNIKLTNTIFSLNLY